MNFLPENPTTRNNLFLIIKWLTYSWLVYNGILFFADEHAASQITYGEGMSLSEVIKVYSAAIDTAFWIFLLLLLELETYIIDDEIFKKPAVKWFMMGLRAICYAVIIYAAYGYIVKMLMQSDIDPFAVASVCDLVGTDYSLLTYIEEYEPFSLDNCGALAGQELGRLNGHNIIAPIADLNYAKWVSWIDVVNSIVWLLVVAMLEIEVWFKLKGVTKEQLLKASKALKFVLYGILFACALFWWYTGVFLDFSDAFLWLFAFFFIEMNMVKWQEEIEEESAAAAASS